MPAERSAEISPRTTTRPSLGGMIPAMTRSSVDFPAPLRPSTPSTDPFGTVTDTPRSAGISRAELAPWSMLEKPLRQAVVSRTSWRSCSDAETSSAEIATGSATTSASDVEGESSFMRKEETSPDDQEHRRPEQRSHELKIRGNPSSDDFLVGGEHWEQRIERHAGPHPRRKERDRIQDRCDEEQDAQEVLHPLGGVEHENGEAGEQQ